MPSTMKFLLMITVHFCATSASWTTEDVSDAVTGQNIEYDDSVLNNDYDVNPIKDIVVKPILLIRILKRAHSSNPSIIPQNSLHNIDEYPHFAQEDKVDNRRLLRSANPIETYQINNVYSDDDDLNVAASSIPFHPLFTIRHREEVKRRYENRRRRRL